VKEIKYQNATYYGEVVINSLGQKMRDGKGVLIYDTGRVYEGEWKEDV